MSITKISITTNPDHLWGGEDQIERYDVRASAAMFDEILRQEVEDAYPGVEVEVAQADVYDNKILVVTENEYDELGTEEAVTDTVRDIIAQVFEGRHGDWAVEVTS